MSTLAFQAPESAVATDDFAALEDRVLRTVELLKSERAARAAAEAKVSELHQSLEAQTAELLRVESEVEAFKSERDLVRGRIERLLAQLDELAV
jgi:chromosome segregation ATPase